MASTHSTGSDDLDFGATLRGFAPGQTVLKRYTLTRLLGRGGMGVVWLAKDNELEEEVALKFLPETLCADRAAVEDLKREVRKARALTHANIVRIHDFVTDGNLAAVAMEYVAGRTLVDLRYDEPGHVFEPARLAPVVQQLAVALDYAHLKAKVVHRDLKPANVMLTSAGEVKILDFGIAASISESASRVSNRGTSGTLTYMSPQQLLGKNPSAADDWYAFGTTLYDLLTGKPPFSRGDLTHLILHEKPESLAARRIELGVTGEVIPPTWETTIAALLAKEPAARPQSGAAVLAMLEGKAGPALAAVPPAENRTDKTDETHKSHASHKPYLKKPLWLTFAAIAAIALGSVGYHYGVSVPEQKRQAELARLEEEKAQAASAAEKARIAAEQEKLRTESEKEARRKEAQAAAADKARGGVLVRTTPSGAEVRVGALALEKSPLTLRDVRLGKYPLKVRLEGYEPSDTEVEVKENDFAEVTIALVRSMGIVTIDSEPRGLAYTLTGEATKRGRTPGREEVPTGPYTVTVDNPGWASQEQLVTVVRKDKVAALAEFVPGKVVITSSPAGAAVKNAAGQALGVTPLTLPEVQPGSVSYTLSLKGYQATAVKGEAKARKAVELGATLSKQAGPTVGEKWTIPDLNLELVPIASGTFTMGGSDGGRGAMPAHQVTLTKPFWLGQYDVTVGQFKAFVGATSFRTEAESGDGMYIFTGSAWVKRAGTSWRNPNLIQADDHPVVGITWNDAIAFCAWLTQTEKQAGRLPEGYEYMLPSEAQWEYSCRAGTTGAYAGSLDVMGWYDANSEKTTHPVGQKQANAWGLFDMHGNVNQWCRDWYGEFDSGSQIDPFGAISGTFRIARGGGWEGAELECRSASRGGNSPGRTSSDCGFRIGIVPIVISSPQTNATKTVSIPHSGEKWTIPDLNLTLVPIAAGTFTLGSNDGEDHNAKPAHQVTITKVFWLGQYEVTQGEYEAVMGSNPSNFKNAGRNAPVEQVLYDEALAFCVKVTQTERAAGRLPEGYEYTLPSEAQWEYACRAGTTGAYAGNLDAMGWYDLNSGGATHAVGQKQANTWGLYDMHGNVWEWCRDWAGLYSRGSQVDPTGAASGSRRVVRGGGWSNPDQICRSANRDGAELDYIISNLGFRLALAPSSR